MQCCKIATCKNIKGHRGRCNGSKIVQSETDKSVKSSTKRQRSNESDKSVKSSTKRQRSNESDDQPPNIELVQLQQIAHEIEISSNRIKTFCKKQTRLSNIPLYIHNDKDCEIIKELKTCLKCVLGSIKNGCTISGNHYLHLSHCINQYNRIKQ